jgi:hypothetical protein
MLKLMSSKRIHLHPINSKQHIFYCDTCNHLFTNINGINTCCCFILTIQKYVTKYINLLYSLTHINYNSQILNYNSIHSFDVSNKKHNDINNKLRERIIGAIINDKIPHIYYKYSNRWTQLKNNVFHYITSLCSNINKTNISCIHKGGRKFNYDFELNFFNYGIKYTYNVELKFNAKHIMDTPQFVSPMKPSQYLSSSYEEYYYDKYLPLLATICNLTVPNKQTYLKEIHATSPKCLIDFQTKYYKGCKNSSKFTGNTEDIMFYKEAKRLSKISIIKFITENELNLHLLTEHLKKTQVEKHYMLYKNKLFHHQHIDINDYELVTCEKQPEKYRFITKTKTGHSITVLLRWKNGNGIAFPAFQIS